MNLDYKSIIIKIFALVGFLTLCFTGYLSILWITKSPDEESTRIETPLERIKGKEQYFGQVNELPLAKSDIVTVTSVNVLSETPDTATLEIHYDTQSSEPLDDVWVSAGLMKDSGYAAMHNTRPAKVSPGRGKIAQVRLGIPEQARFEILASNFITIDFYKGGQMPFHQAKFGYERIWCRKITGMSDLWKEPYPKEKGSKYSINGSRSVSRLCLMRGS